MRYRMMLENAGYVGTLNPILESGGDEGDTRSFLQKKSRTGLFRPQESLPHTHDKHMISLWYLCKKTLLNIKLWIKKITGKMTKDEYELNKSVVKSTFQGFNKIINVIGNEVRSKAKQGQKFNMNDEVSEDTYAKLYDIGFDTGRATAEAAQKFGDKSFNLTEAEKLTEMTKAFKHLK